MNSRWYTPNLHVVTTDIYTFDPPWHQGLYAGVKLSVDKRLRLDSRRRLLPIAGRPTTP